MKRGPPPAKGFDLAIPVAHMRGSVMLFRQSPWYSCDFTINGNGIFAVVRLRMATRFRATIEEITRDYPDDIASLAAIPGGGPLSRELWFYSRYRTLRFFRLGDAGLIEIDCYGMAFVNGKPVITVAMPGIPVRPDSLHAGPAPGLPTPGLPGSSGPHGSASGTPRNPVIRWLTKKNAGKNPVTGEPVPSVPANPVYDAGASGPATAGDGKLASGTGQANADQPVVPGTGPPPGEPDPDS